MKRLLFVFTSVFLMVLLAAGPAGARNTAETKRLHVPVVGPIAQENSLSLRPFTSPSVSDTTQLGYWTFDGTTCTQQGWTTADRTEQTGDYFHVDDFGGLGGGNFGRLVPLQGNQSLWCGARPDGMSQVLCAYAALPGYGDNWNQAFCTDTCLTVVGDVIVDYQIAWDCETGYDFIYIEYDECDDNWQEMAQYNSIGSVFASQVIDSVSHSGTVRVRFRFQSDDAFSDEDGLWDTDGAVIIDSLTLSDNTGAVLPTELFETESVGDLVTTSGNWASCTIPGYGDYAFMLPGAMADQKLSECTNNWSCMWGFFQGSTYNYACNGLPTQPVVPYGNSRGQYINNEIHSPLIPWTGTGNEAMLEFDMYADLPLNALIVYTWHVRSIVGGCPGPWRDRDFYIPEVPYGWNRFRFSIGNLIDPAATHIQVAMGVRDMCGVWCGIYGDGTCHSHTPLFDNVEVYRINITGPRWSARDIDLFQDNFSADGSITGPARADMANDILPGSSSGILPGDSVVVTCSDPDAGLAADPNTGFGPAVYCYVYVENNNHAPYVASSLTQDPLRWPVVGSQLVDGDTWHQIRMDTCFTGAGRLSPVDDKFCIDLNDNLFVPGDTVFFFFGGQSDAPSNEITYFATGLGYTNEGLGYTFAAISDAAANADEFTILPAGGYNRGGEVLYVDGMNFRGSQPYFDSAHEFLNVLDETDRYDIRGPSSAAGNRLGGRVVNEFNQIIPIYGGIFWDTGNLSYGTIGDGTGNPEKSDDARVLFNFMDNLARDGGVYFSGDDIAEEWVGLQGYAVQLRNTFMNFDVTTGDHADKNDPNNVGASPLVVGAISSCFYDTLGIGAWTWVAHGGCPMTNDFDVLSTGGGASRVEANYVGNGNTAPAMLHQVTNNTAGFDVGIVLSGFSFYSIRDAGPNQPPNYTAPMRSFILQAIGRCGFGGVGPLTWPVGADGLSRNALDQNHPNPFNPVTTITYSIKERGHVSLKVYNVAGQLVKTLIDEVQSPQSLKPIEWRGHNNSGQTVSSGVYFYRLVTKGFTKTKKMVLLK